MGNKYIYILYDHYNVFIYCVSMYSYVNHIYSSAPKIWSLIAIKLREIKNGLGRLTIITQFASTCF